jgi:hypothetical protein
VGYRAISKKKHAALLIEVGFVVLAIFVFL